jgi:hypothetical protein
MIAQVFIALHFALILSHFMIEMSSRAFFFGNTKGFGASTLDYFFQLSKSYYF